MAQPPSYNREHNFVLDEEGSVNSTALNAELDNASASINKIRDNLSKIQSDDGSLKAGIVTRDALSADVVKEVVDEVESAANRAEIYLKQAEAAANSAIKAKEDVDDRAAEILEADRRAEQNAATTVDALRNVLEVEQSVNQTKVMAEEVVAVGISAKDATVEAAENANQYQIAASGYATQAQSYAQTAAYSYRYCDSALANGTYSIDSLTPKNNVKVGDHVLSSVGDLFEIVTVTSTTFTLGKALTSLRGAKGEQGERGIQGVKGPQGIQGVQGIQGEQGERGLQGFTFTPSITSDGEISWSNNGGLSNPPVQNIRGPQGPRGEKGDRGEAGAGLTLNGELGSYNDLVATRPVGQPGDAYLIQGDLWYWAEDDNAWKNAGPFRGPQGVRGPQGFTFTPIMASNGTLSWSNNGDLENPASKNLTGPRGYHFTPAVDGSGNLSWSNDGDLANPASKNIRGPRGFMFTPSVDGKGNISWSNNGNLDNPTTRNIRGYHYTPSLDGKGNLSWTNNGELENPATKNIRGYHFTPSVDGKGNLSWTNNGDLDNPATQNIRGYHYTPSVDDNGNISWTNNGDLDNPATKNIRGPRGFTFTPSMASDGTLSWSNNGGLANPSPQNLTGPRGFSVRDALLTEEFTAEEFWLYTDSSLQLWWKVSNASDFVAGDVACIHKVLEIDGYAQPYQITCFGVVTDTRSNEIRVSIFARVRDGVNGTDGKKGEAFEYDDFTPDQLEALKGPKGDTGPGMKSINVGSKNSSFFNVEAGKHVTFGCEEQPIALYPGDMLCAYGTMSDQEDNFAILFGEISTLNFDSEGNWQIGLYVRGQFRALRGQKGDTGATGATGPRGYTFTPSVSSAGVLSWKNDGNLTNPSSVNLKGADGKDGVTFTPSITNGVLSWTNDGNLANPANVTVEGKDGKDGTNGKNGATFTPSVSSSGVLSWTNDGGLANPSSVNIKGPKGDTGPAGGVTSVNGMTGAVVIDVGSGGGGGSGDAIPKTGNRGLLGGYALCDINVDESAFTEGIDVTVNRETQDAQFYVAPRIKLDDIPQTHWMDTGTYIGQAETWTKVVFLYFPESIELGEGWIWLSGSQPELGVGGLLVLHVNADCGFVSFIPMPL